MTEGFGKKKLVRDISANTLQTAITQLFGLAIFYLISKFLPKSDFGEFNWSLAVGSTIIAISSLGLDLIYVKRIARGESVLVMSGIHFFHTVVVGIVLSGVAYIVNFFIPSFNSSHPVFFLVFINLSLANVANSFKLCLNGLESYRRLAILALVSNTLRFVIIISLYVTGVFSIVNVICAYIITSLAEFLLAYWMLSNTLAHRVKPVLKIVEYKYFVLESLPQLGVVLFDSALARIDWILLGVIGTAAATAEYSFAYKVFELSKLPLLIIAPILLTRFSKMFRDGEDISGEQKNSLLLLFKVEMMVVMMIPIVLAVSWSPLIDYFTDGKYGLVNVVNYRILAFCVPLHAMINFLWTLGFVQGQLRTIMIITIVVSVLNIVANALLIPHYGALGSSMAFLACTLVQLILYLRLIHQQKFRVPLLPPFFFLISAVVAVYISTVLVHNVIFACLIAIGVYALLMMLSKQFKPSEILHAIRQKN